MKIKIRIIIRNFGKESGSHTCANNKKSSKDLRLKNWVVPQLCASVQTHLYKSVEQQITTITVIFSSLIQESDGSVTSIHILSIFIKSFSEKIKTSAFWIISDSSITLSPIHTVRSTRSAFWYKDVTAASSFLTVFHRYMKYKWHTLLEMSRGMPRWEASTCSKQLNPSLPQHITAECTRVSNFLQEEFPVHLFLCATFEWQCNLQLNNVQIYYINACMICACVCSCVCLLQLRNIKQISKRSCLTKPLTYPPSIWALLC